MSPHRRANLLLLHVNDKPPFNRRLCVRKLFFLSSPSFFLLLSPFRFSDRNKAKKKCCSTLVVWGFCEVFFFFKKRVSGRGRPLRGDGGSSSTSDGDRGGGAATRVHAAAAPAGAGAEGSERESLFLRGRPEGCYSVSG